jgi:hypothetical protein
LEQRSRPGNPILSAFDAVLIGNGVNLSHQQAMLGRRAPAAAKGKRNGLEAVPWKEMAV